MSLALSPEILAGVYASLRVCPPFRRWKLPAAEGIKFRVTNHKDREGHYTRYVRTSEHFIAVSQAAIGHFDSLAVVMAHEMIHLAQAVLKCETRNAEHNADFRRRAALVCKTLGFDPHLFC